MKQADYPRIGQSGVPAVQSSDANVFLEFLRFTAVGASGVVVNQALLVAITELLGVHYVLSATVATIGSSTWNFLWIERWAFGSRHPNTRLGNRYLGFIGLNVGLLVLRLPLLWFLTEFGHVGYALSNLVTLVAFFAVRLAVSHRWLWDRGRLAAVPVGGGTSVGPARTLETAARHAYDIGGILSIESDVVLRELAYFQTVRVSQPDIRIHVGLVSPRPTRRVVFEDTGEDLVYREHLGPFAANFALRMGHPIEIRVSPVLAISPHVVYTNIVEALLRFLLVSKGYVLLHSAAIADENGATLLSAQTDTGKTSTVITLVRSGQYRFLSDDMTIIDPQGEAISYPKPMTLSFHTMGVAKDGHLTTSDRAALAIQSRLHSKSGRRVGQSLGKQNLPIMTMNSIVQALVPPPKHRIDALFECVVGGHAPIRNVVLMERGDKRQARLPLEETVRRLIENTDDAYGFPPFSLFAPHIRINGLDYAALRKREAELLGTAIAKARAWDLRVPGHEWAEQLPGIIKRPVLVSVGPGFTVQRPAPRPAPAPVQRPFAPEILLGEATLELVPAASDPGGE